MYLSFRQDFETILVSRYGMFVKKENIFKLFMIRANL